MASERIDRIKEILVGMARFRLCGPGDDPDEITNVTIGFRSLLIQLKRLAGPLLPMPLSGRLESLDVEVDNVYTVYEAKSEIAALTVEINEVLDGMPERPLSPTTGRDFVDAKLVELIELTYSPDYDLTLLGRLCRDINGCYSQGYLVATLLLVRSVLNYVPPVFGNETFAQVAASSGRSLKPLFMDLENNLRKVSDFHAHRKIDTSDEYPSLSQIEPFRPSFELLLQEMLQRAGKKTGEG